MNLEWLKFDGHILTMSVDGKKWEITGIKSISMGDAPLDDGVATYPIKLKSDNK